MEQFFRTIALVLLAVVFVLILKNNTKGIGELLTLLVCCMVLSAAISYLQPVIDFMKSVQQIGGLDNQMLKLLLKVVGISITAEIVSLLCEDSGNSAMGKTIQFLATAVMIWLSLPMLTSFLQLIEGILDRL